jgi:hypothetical protein
MSTETVVRLRDDVDGTEADATIIFGWDGKVLEIDLADKNRRALEAALQPFVDAARCLAKLDTDDIARLRRKRIPTVSHVPRPDLRRWARSRGYQVSDRGRLPLLIFEAYAREVGDAPRDSAALSTLSNLGNGGKR